MAETIAVRQRVRGLLPRGKGLRMEIGSIYELNPETLPKGEKAEEQCGIYHVRQGCDCSGFAEHR